MELSLRLMLSVPYKGFPSGRLSASARLYGLL